MLGGKQINQPIASRFETFARSLFADKAFIQLLFFDAI